MLGSKFDQDQEQTLLLKCWTSNFSFYISLLGMRREFLQIIFNYVNVSLCRHCQVIEKLSEMLDKMLDVFDYPSLTSTDLYVFWS